MACKHYLHRSAVKTWSLVLLGVAVCLLLLMGIWVHDSSSARQARLVDVREREVARARSAAEPNGSGPQHLGGPARVPASLPDAARWIREDAANEDETLAALELDFQMVAGVMSELAGATQRPPNGGFSRASGQASEHEASEHEARSGSAPERWVSVRDPLASVQHHNHSSSASGASAEAMDAAARTGASLQVEPPRAEAGSARLDAPAAPPGERCGVLTCPAGGVCCNASCGTCVLPGETCSQLSCSVPRYPVSIPCGRSTCVVGEICCNASCGTCTLPEETCAQAICD
jgi:hypothetical protein